MRCDSDLKKIECANCWYQGSNNDEVLCQVLPLDLKYPPMEANKASKLPQGPNWQYEPKWDGFRCLAYRDNDQVNLMSKSGQNLSRYFPEIVDVLLQLKAKKFVLDGELVIEQGKTFSFDALLSRLHPAQSRINKLSVQTPATYIIFDLLVTAAEKLIAGKPLADRRKELGIFAEKYSKENSRLVLSPICLDSNLVDEWQELIGTKLDGIIAKDTTLPYQSGTRKGMVKVKWLRTADCVVGGFRYSIDESAVGSLLLGLYDDKNLLNHVGFTSSFNQKQKKELLTKLKPLIAPPGFTGDAPGAPSRWSTERSAQWCPLKTELVVEIQYDHFSNGRFWHGTKFLRWRPDKIPQQCNYQQVHVPRD